MNSPSRSAVPFSPQNRGVIVPLNSTSGCLGKRIRADRDQERFHVPFGLDEWKKQLYPEIEDIIDRYVSKSMKALKRHWSCRTRVMGPEEAEKFEKQDREQPRPQLRHLAFQRKMGKRPAHQRKMSSVDMLLYGRPI